MYEHLLIDFVLNNSMTKLSFVHNEPEKNPLITIIT